MANLPKKLILAALSLFADVFGYLKNTLMPGLSSPCKQALKDSFEFLTTMENIHVSCDVGIVQNAWIDDAKASSKNLLTCSIGEETPVLFFNISGSEFMELYTGLSVAGVRNLFEQTWRKTLHICRQRKAGLQNRVAQLNPQSLTDSVNH